jgi:uncharacterized membrane protein (UPF0127 family)
MLRIAVLALVLALTACDSRQPGPLTTASELGLETRFPVRIGAIQAQVRVAASELEKARGLMGVTRLAEAEGMAFMYDAETRMSFWMKDTPLDLDIAFVARDGAILEVRTMTAGDTGTTASLSDQARFAVEMRAGWFRDRGIKPGDKVAVEDLRTALRARGFEPGKFLP